MDPERTADLGAALRPEAQEAAERGELRRERPLELAQLLDVARVRQLAQARLDAGTDPAQLAHPARGHEVEHGRGQAADRLGGPPVGPRRVVPGARELEQRGVLLEPGGDCNVVEWRHRARLTP